jgi:hypothetical protein
VSVHLVECAAEVQLPPSLKLTLLCFADSGSNESRVALPGLENVMRWTGVGKSQALNLVKQLQELQLLAVRMHGYRGRRSEYVVFPNGCCERHGKVPAGLRLVDGERDEKGSDRSDPLLGASLSTASDTSDPLPSTGSDPTPGKGPISDAERVRRPRSNREPSQRLTPTDRPPGSELTGPRESREAWPSLDFTRVVDLEPDQPDRTPLAPSARGSCPHCYDGDILDALGEPVAKCPHCQPASRGATA